MHEEPPLSRHTLTVLSLTSRKIVNNRTLLITRPSKYVTEPDLCARTIPTQFFAVHFLLMMNRLLFE